MHDMSRSSQTCLFESLRQESYPKTRGLYTGTANSMCPKCPGQALYFRPHVAHLRKGSISKHYKQYKHDNILLALVLYSIGILVLNEDAYIPKASKGPRAGSYRPSGMGCFKLSKAKGLVSCFTLSLRICVQKKL